MKLRALKTAPSLAGMRVLVRVDWNVPLDGSQEPEASLKIERSLETIEWLVKKKAIVILLTHLGRPHGYEARYSTEHLLKPLKKTYHITLQFHPESVSQKKECKDLLEKLEAADHGSVHLLQNVRFEAGEEKNAVALAKAYASLGHVFVNDAFASCHRAHTSVVGITKFLPAYAGFSLQSDVEALVRLIQTPPTPTLALLSTGSAVIRSTLSLQN